LTPKMKIIYRTEVSNNPESCFIKNSRSFSMIDQTISKSIPK